METTSQPFKETSDITKKYNERVESVERQVRDRRKKQVRRRQNN